MISILMIWLSLASAAPSDPLWDRGLAAYQRGDFRKSQKLWFQLVRKNPNKALYWFNLGNAYFMVKSFRSAEICFKKVETLKSPLTPAAQLYRAKSLIEQGRRDDAEEILASLQSAATPTAIRLEASRDLKALGSDFFSENSEEALSQYRRGQYKKALRTLNRRDVLSADDQMLKALILIRLDRPDEAHNLLSQMKETEAGEIRALVTILLDRLRDSYSKKYWLFIETAAGHSANVTSAPDAEGGTPLTADLGAGVRLWTKNLWYLTTSYQLALLDVPDHSDLRILRHEVRAPFGRELGTDLFLLTPRYSHETWGTESAQTLSGLSLRFRGGDSRFEYGTEGEWDSAQGENADYSYLSGFHSTYRLYVGSIRFPFYWRASLSFFKWDIGDQSYSTGKLLPSAHRGFSPSARAIWKMKDRWLLEASLSYTVRHYATPALPVAVPREDKEWSLSPRLTYLMNPRLSFYADGEYRKNSSTLGADSGLNQNYSDTSLKVGLLWDAI